LQDSQAGRGAVDFERLLYERLGATLGEYLSRARGADRPCPAESGEIPAPVLHGLAGDLADVPTMMLLVAAVVLVTLPLAWRLGPYLHETAMIQRW
jgi:hypothetical protein